MTNPLSKTVHPTAFVLGPDAQAWIANRITAAFIDYRTQSYTDTGRSSKRLTNREIEVRSAWDATCRFVSAMGLRGTEFAVDRDVHEWSHDIVPRESKTPAPFTKDRGNYHRALAGRIQYEFFGTENAAFKL